MALIAAMFGVGTLNNDGFTLACLLTVKLHPINIQISGQTIAWKGQNLVANLEYNYECYWNEI